jgi:two-component system response regulator AtoC
MEYRGSVLIVDDEESIRNVIRRSLEADWLRCDTASSGQEALEKAAMQEFDVVLLDILMPGLTGLEVLETLAKRDPFPQVIMVTSVADIEIIGEAMKLGAFDYVVKPININDIVSRVEKAIEARRAGSDQ